jgi:hypothetical protein
MDKDGADFSARAEVSAESSGTESNGSFAALLRSASRERQGSVIYTLGSRCLGRSEPILVDTEAANLRFKRLARNSQLGRRTGGARDSSVALR